MFLTPQIKALFRGFRQIFCKPLVLILGFYSTLHSWSCVAKKNKKLMCNTLEFSCIRGWQLDMCASGVCKKHKHTVSHLLPRTSTLTWSISKNATALKILHFLWVNAVMLLHNKPLLALYDLSGPINQVRANWSPVYMAVEWRRERGGCVRVLSMNYRSIVAWSTSALYKKYFDTFHVKSKVLRTRLHIFWKMHI